MSFLFSAWKRSAKSDLEDDSANEQSGTERGGREAGAHNSHGSGGEGGQSGKEDGKDANHKPKARMSFKAASQATLSFLSARKRIEDGLKNWNKRRLSKRDSVEGEQFTPINWIINTEHLPV